MKDGASPEDLSDRALYCHRDRHLLVVIGLLAGLLALTLAAALFGPAFDSGARDPLWALVASFFLAALIGVFARVLWRRPVVLRVGPAGLERPTTWARPLP